MNRPSIPRLEGRGVFLCTSPVPRGEVDDGRVEHAEPVLETQGLDREAGELREAADGDEIPQLSLLVTSLQPNKRGESRELSLPRASSLSTPPGVHQCESLSRRGSMCRRRWHDRPRKG